MNVTIYHNPRCSKSRQTLQLLTEQGIEANIVEYLNAPPSADELKQILNSLDMKPRKPPIFSCFYTIRCTSKPRQQGQTAEIAFRIIAISADKKPRNSAPDRQSTD